MISPRRSPLKRSAIKRSNPKRKKREFARTYHSKQRVEFVKSLPCVGCRVVGYSENAHIEGGGTGYKARYDRIAPLCGPHLVQYPEADGDFAREQIAVGCHRELHIMGLAAFEIEHAVLLDKAAAECEQKWQEYSNGKSREQEK